MAHMHRRAADTGRPVIITISLLNLSVPESTSMVLGFIQPAFQHPFVFLYQMQQMNFDKSTAKGDIVHSERFLFLALNVFCSFQKVYLHL